MTLSRSLRVGVAAVLLLALIGPSAVGWAAPAGPAQRGGVVRFGTAFEPARLNPALFPSPADRQVTELVYNRLIKPDKSMKLAPDLAERYEISRDNLVVTFHLRRNVRWHDGQPFTAKDVAFTFRSLVHPDYAGGQVSFASMIKGAMAYRERRANEVEGIRIVNDQQIQFTLESVHGPALANFTHPILPEHILGSVNPGQWDRHATNRDKPIGTGPFKITSVTPQQFVELEANPDYFEGRPNLDRFVWVLGQENTLLSSLLAGRIDAMRVPVTEADNVKRDRRLNLIEMRANAFSYFGFNMAHPLLRQLRMRQAFAHAIDREQICKSVLKGYCQVVNVPMPAPMWSYNGEPKGYRYDPARANAILEEMGWKLNAQTGVREKDGKKLEFELVWSTPEMDAFVPVLQQDLKKVGIQINTVRIDWPTMVATKLLPRTRNVPRPPTGEELQTWLLFRQLLLEPLGEAHYGCENFPPRGFNFTQYCNRLVNKMLNDQLKIMDRDERAKIYGRVMAFLAHDIPWIPLYSGMELYASTNRLRNFDPGINGVTQNVREWSLQR